MSNWFVYLSVFEELYDEVISKVLEEKSISKPIGFLYSKAQSKRVDLENYYQLDVFSSIVEQSIEHEPDLDLIRDYEDKFSTSSLSLIIFADRHIGYSDKYSYKQKLSLIELTFKYAISLVENNELKFAWFESISGFVSYILYLVFKESGVKICAVETGRFPGKLAVTDNKNLLWDGVEEEISKISSGSHVSEEETQQAIDFIKEYREVLPVPTAYSKKYLPRIRIKDLFLWYKWFRDYFSDNHGMVTTSPVVMLLRKFKRIIRSFLANRLFEKVDDNELGDFVFFPLHFQPEATTLVCAPHCLNQVSVIEDIAKSLPVGCKLVVKEHHDSIGRRRIRDYLDIKTNWNVVLVGPKDNSLELVKKCKGVVTITSTVGLQALLLRKPVITLARVSYDACPAVVRAYDCSKEGLNELIVNALDVPIREKDVINFCIAVNRKLTDSNGIILNHPLYQDEVMEVENIKKISKVIKADLLNSINK